MGLVGISPPATLSPRVVRLTRERAKGDAEPKTDGHPPGSVEAALPLTPQRLELIKACAENVLRKGESMTASRIAQRFAPRVPEGPVPSRKPPVPQTLPAAPLAALAAGMRRLTALLILATLLPNLTLAIFWLGLIDLPWSKPVDRPASEKPLPAAQTPPPLPVLSSPAVLEAPAGGVVGLPIALDGTDGIPAGSVILIKGLPPGAVLSSGEPRTHSYGGTDWTLKPGDIGDLHLAIPETASGATALTIQLAAPGNRIVADASTLLNVTAPLAPSVEPFVGVAGPAEPEALDGATQDMAALEEDMTAAIEPVSVDPEAPPLPDRRPEPPAGDDDSADWVRPSAYVNLRQGPSSSAQVVGVVAKGTKLRVMTRKRGWVQVKNPATSQTGWIYSGNVAAAR